MSWSCQSLREGFIGALGERLVIEQEATAHLGRAKTRCRGGSEPPRRARDRRARWLPHNLARVTLSGPRCGVGASLAMMWFSSQRLLLYHQWCFIQTKLPSGCHANPLVRHVDAVNGTQHWFMGL